MTGPRGVATIAFAIALSACMGPRPVVVTSVLSEPRTPEGPYTVRATIRNAGGGEGQVQATASLRSKSTREIVAQSSRQIDLPAHESVQVTFTLDAPRGGDYEVSVDAKYPP